MRLRIRGRLKQTPSASEQQSRARARERKQTQVRVSAPGCAGRESCASCSRPSPPFSPSPSSTSTKMAPLHRTAVFIWTLLSLVFVALAQRDPEHAITYFPNLPARLFFFNDASVCCINIDSARGLHYHRQQYTMTRRREWFGFLRIRARRGRRPREYQRAKLRW